MYKSVRKITIILNLEKKSKSKYHMDFDIFFILKGSIISSFS